MSRNRSLASHCFALTLTSTATLASTSCSSDVETTGDGGGSSTTQSISSGSVVASTTVGASSSTSSSAQAATSTASSSTQAATSSQAVTTNGVGPGGGGDGGGGVGGQGAGGFGENGTTEFSAVSDGDPAWEIIDWQHYAATIGTMGNNFAQLRTNLEAVWPLHQFYTSVNLLGPGDVHQPPYDGELLEGVLGAGFDEGNRFPFAAWSSPQGLILSATIVPTADATTGSSTDFDDGPIIPTTLFPLHVDGDLFREGALVDPDFDSDYPTIDSIPPGQGVDGYSHMTLTFAESTEYIAGTPGNYTYRIILTDADGAAWATSIPFTIE